MKQSEKQKIWKINHYNENKDLYKSKQSERRKVIKEYIESKKEKMCFLWRIRRCMFRLSPFKWRGKRQKFGFCNCR